MKITTKDIIKMLPLEDSLKTELLGQFDNLHPDKKLNLEQLLWEAYDGLFALKLEENTQLALLAAKQKKETLDKNFYVRMRDKTEKEMSSDTLQITQTVDLTEARQAMEFIVKEIQASKKRS